jgi:inhibitor of KinA sporulation pathway (predicted exonuclease)
MSTTLAKTQYLVLDFEANCSDNQVRDHEIIEFPGVLVNADSGVIVSEFRTFVKMITHKHLSDFIKNLTHITDEEVQNGLSWTDSLVAFEQWCKNFSVTPENTTVVTCGDWDLKTMLANQLTISRTKLSPFLNELFGCWTNMKVSYRNAFGNERMIGMDAMLQELGIPLIGHHHSGIDDCRNIAKICRVLNTKGTHVEIPNKIREVPFWYDNGTSETLYGTSETLYGTSETLYGTSETLYGTSETLYGTSETLYGTSETLVYTRNKRGKVVKK